MNYRQMEREVQPQMLLLGRRPRRPRLRRLRQLPVRPPRSESAAVLRAEDSELALAESMPVGFAEPARCEVLEGPARFCKVQDPKILQGESILVFLRIIFGLSWGTPDDSCVRGAGDHR